MARVRGGEITYPESSKERAMAMPNLTSIVTEGRIDQGDSAGTRQRPFKKECSSHTLCCLYFPCSPSSFLSRSSPFR